MFSLLTWRTVLRRLVARPGYVGLSVAVLGTGLGAVLFLFGIIHGMILQPLPYPHADRLVGIEYATDLPMRGAEYRQLRDRLHTMGAIGAYSQDLASVGPQGAEQTRLASKVTASLFDLLGVHPLLGRAFDAQDEQAGAPLRVLIGYRLWQRLGGRRDVVGRTITVNGRQARVIGVMPRGFAFPFAAQLWLPVRFGAGDDVWLRAVARLQPSSTLAAARAELRAATSGDERALPGQRDGLHLELLPLARHFVPDNLRDRLWMMFAAGLLVLLLACTNVASLQVVQTVARRRELALRGALGAGRRQLLAVPLAESLLLSLLATVFALWLVTLGNRWIDGLMSASVISLPYYMHFGIGAPMLAFAVLVALVTTGLAGLLPAWHAWRTNAQEVLREGSKGTQGRGFRRMTGSLVVIEIALTVVLLVGAGTFVRALLALHPHDANGVRDPGRVLVEQVAMPGARWADANARLQFLEQVARQVRQEAGVVDAAFADVVPDADGYTVAAAALGTARPASGYLRAQAGAVDLQFARTYGVRMRSGRFFDAADRHARRAVAVVDSALARRLWPGRDPIGQSLVIGPGDPQPTQVTVVGVAAPLHLDRTTRPQRPTVLVPLWLWTPRYAYVAVRTHGDPLAFEHRLNTLIQRSGGGTPLFGARTQATAIALGHVSVSVFTQVFSVLGGATLLLAAAGLYGFLAFSVAQRTREIGIRRAIGAGSLHVVGYVGRQLLVQLGVGLAVGLALAWPWARLLADPELHTPVADPALFGAVAALVVLVALLATLVPLVRALRIDPAVALRYE